MLLAASRWCERFKSPFTEDLTRLVLRLKLVWHHLFSTMVVLYYQSSTPVIEEVMFNLHVGGRGDHARSQSDEKSVDIPSLKIDDELLVTVGEVIEPDHFYLVCESHNEEYEKLKTNMTKFYKNVNEESPRVFGDFKAAPIPHSDHWGRVKLLTYFGSSCLCLFIDEGFTALVPTNQINPLLNLFKKLPPRSFSTYLYNVESPNDFWLEEHIEIFKALVLDKKLKAFVDVDDHGGYGCVLVQDDININEQFFSIIERN